jgi:hypothetical protein
MKEGGSQNDLDAKLDALYAASLADFVAARNALAKSLDASGRKDDAARVKALKKPSAPAWAVNQLAFREPQLLAALVAAGDRLRAKPGAVKETMRERRDALQAAAKAAERALAGAGHGANADAARRISATLEAVATWGRAPGAPAVGRLAEDVPAPGFDEIAALGLLGAGAGPRAAEARPAPPPSPKTQPPPAPKAPSKADLARERAESEARRREDEKRVSALKHDALRARAALAAAEKAAAARHRRKVALETALAEADAEEKRFDAELADARRASDVAEAALRAATSSRPPSGESPRSPRA